MERLTMASEKGGVAFTFDLEIMCNPSEALKILKLAKKLKEYEDLEEQGLLLRLPCKVGDYVYDIKYNNRIRRSQVTRYDMAQNIGKKYKEHIHTIFNGFHGCFPISDIGKIVFLTQAEAEEALERMEKERTVWRD